MVFRRRNSVCTALSKQRVPRRLSSSFALSGGLCLLSLGLLALSGVALVVRFRPTTAQSALSVALIQNHAAFGWLFRGLHIGASHAFAGLLLAHLAGNYWLRLRGADRQHQSIWKTGIVVFFLWLIVAWTGGILPFDEKGQAAANVAAAIAYQTPVTGPWIHGVLRDPVANLYWVHIALAATMAVPAWIHLKAARAQRLYLFRLNDKNRQRISPRTVIAITAGAWLFFGILILVASPFLGELPTAPSVRPVWYFFPLFETVRIFPVKIGPLPGAPIAIFSYFGLIFAALLVPSFARKGG